MTAGTSPPGDRRLERACSTVLVAWAAGAVLLEGLEQIALYAGLLAAAFALRARRPPRDVTRVAAASAALAGWQALSPLLAHWAGSAAAWPRSGRYGQLADSLAPAVVALLAGVYVPWRAVLGVLGWGWLASAALGTYQHFVRWPFGELQFFHTPFWRVQEPFGSGASVRYAAGGFHFHRLRFAHGAVALLGFPIAAWRSGVAPGALLAAFAGALVWGLSITYARAALLVGIFVLLALLLARRRARPVALVAAAACAALLATSPVWRARLSGAAGNLEDDRGLAMRVGLILIARHPFVGVGFGTYQESAELTRKATGLSDLLSIDAHDLWLTAWAETGLPGLLLLAAFHALLARALWTRMRAGAWPALAGLAAFAGYHLLALVHYLPHHTSVQLTFALAWGLGLAPATGGARSRREPGADAAEAGS